MTSSETVGIAAASLQCAEEPIHIPGSIQPHGFMIVLDEAISSVLQVSENVQQWLGLAPAAMLGQGLAELLEDGERVAARLRDWPGDEQHPFHFGEVRFSRGSRLEQPISMMVHSYDGLTIAEFEPVREDVATAYGNLYPLVRTFIGRMQEAEDIQELCERAVAEVKRITGFGRVKAYSFDREGNGVVLAEARDPDYPSYLGLCFPASDIPAQARQLYCNNRIRVIENCDYQPSPLVPALNPVTGRALDMSFAALRAVSPVHLQYMRNMGTAASMSISIVVQGQLWGLITGHHAKPHSVEVQTRTACELLGGVLALQVESKLAHATSQHMLGLRHQIVRLLSAMADRDSVAEGLLSEPDVFMSFVRAQGAAIITHNQCHLLGRTPTKMQVEKLASWLASREAGEVFSSDNVGRDIPQLPALAEHVGGVLAVAISQLHSHYLIWFKPEQARTVSWAGQPTKTINPSGALNPRASFESWEQTVRGYSSPWDTLELEGVAELRMATLGIVLRKAEEVAALAGELTKSNKELEAFSYSVSHDLRAPLRHIAGYAELLSDFEGTKLSERGLRFLEHIGESARFAGTLVDNLLSFSQMGRSALHHSDVDLNVLVEAIRREMLPDYEGRNVEWKVAPLPLVIADAAFLHLAMRNLLSNAIKYTRKSDPAVIEINAHETAEEVVISVRDNGVGFDMAYAGKLFGVFQRLHRMEEFEGTGIGLASVRRIIERHDGRVWAESSPGSGAVFFFALPRRGYPAVE
ncbi:ATP-binding protein [Pseudomonas sp. nanlin1]|uniref:ATP-binding protein n=1 Tax=Pseudomonas sp. nanlin1 TaxID=3040605 RepID=UPI00388D4A14